MAPSATTNLHLAQVNRDDDKTIADYVRVQRLGERGDVFTIKLGEYPSEITVFVEESDLQQIADIVAAAAFKAHLEREGVIV